MATAPATWTHEALAAAPQTYFDAVDAQDVDAICAHFADDALAPWRSLRSCPSAWQSSSDTAARTPPATSC